MKALIILAIFAGISPAFAADVQGVASKNIDIGPGGEIHGPLVVRSDDGTVIIKLDDTGSITVKR